MADFDDLVGRLDYPMYIVTTRNGDRRAGCLIGFASQSSIDPPRFTVWLSKRNHTYQVARAATHLAVHVPTEASRDVAELFGTVTGFDEDKFTRCAWRPGPHDLPILDACPQWFTGRILARHDTGDHEAVLLDPTGVGSPGAGQLNFQQVRALTPGNEA